ncbi:hypothetical protein [Streptomyces silvensis]|uniref:Uncharacterized protein n=1 Tax=Streptomyces silvensis TaxID=1765722 RepID=A0A0W7X6S2_9ACTN|nr:hypothetical protein [Streptomyces silvensis]KUF18418.1 hypothetical protein AT728_18895 [Streptomyces silvensis]
MRLPRLRRHTPPAPFTAPQAPPRPVLLREDALVRQLADGSVEANGWAPCPAEERARLHALHADGSRTCWTCRWTTQGDS